MRIVELQLRAFGPFTDTGLDLSEGTEGLHIVYGPNEAGKSSIAEALSTVLFADPSARTTSVRSLERWGGVGGMKLELDFEQGWKTTEGIYRTKEMIYEYWIGKDDYLIRKRILTERKLVENPLPLDDLSDESTRQIITEYYDFNEPVEIVAPLDESGELLEGWVLTTPEE